MQTTTTPRPVRAVFDRLNAVPLDAAPDLLLAVMRAQGRIEQHWLDVLPAPIPAPSPSALVEAREMLAALLDDPALSVADRLTLAAARAELRPSHEASA